MTYNQLYSLQAGSIVCKVGGQKTYVYSGVNAGGMYFFTEIPADEEAEPEDLTIMREELLNGYIKIA